tara:strand:- start:47 stop:967 length:921 start_codon:yes stop_codon:yes gene_type:complete
VYDKAYEEAVIDGFKTHDQIMEWLIEKGVWSGKQEGDIKLFTKDIEKFKVEMYNNRHEKKKYNKIRLYLRKAESESQKLILKKTSYYENSCEGLAQTEKVSWIVRNCSYKDGKPYEFNDTGLSLERAMVGWQAASNPERSLRNLATNEPWSSLWNSSKKCDVKLFYNDELTMTQKQLLMWSQTYDSVYESPDCPPNFVIEDEDLLDGWFILQHRKIKADKEKEDIDKKLGKNADKQEVFIMGKNNKEQIETIEEYNDTEATIRRKSRSNALSKVDKGVAIEHINMPDVQQDLKLEATKKAMERNRK